MSGQTYARLSLYYGLFYTTIAVFNPYFNLYLQSHGLDSASIGLVLAVPPLVALGVQPLWGVIHDRWPIHKWTVGMSLLAAPLVALTTLHLHSVAGFMFVIAAVAVFQTGVMPIMDSSTVRITGVRSYGKVRLFGSMGWALAAVAAASVYHRVGVEILPWLYLATGVLALLGLLGYPSVPSIKDIRVIRDGTDRRPVAETTMGRWAVSRWDGLSRLLKNRQLMAILGLTLLVTASQAMNSNFYTLYYHNLEHPMALLGTIYALGALSELPFFYVVGPLMEKWGAPTVFLVGGMVFAIRWGALALAPPTWVLLLLQLLHGVSFGFTFAAGVAMAATFSDIGNRATAQSLYSAVNTGLSVIVGSLVGGLAMQRFGPQGLYAVATGLSLVGLSLLAWLLWHGRVHPPGKGESMIENTSF